MEAIGDIARRLVERASHQREAMDGQSGANDVPGVQPHPEEEAGSVPERDGHRGRDPLALLALRMGGRGQ